MSEPDGDEARFRRQVEVASAEEAGQRWEQAGIAWIEAARIAIDARVLAAARQCLHAAAEAFRRDDRPVAAERALETLLSLGPDPVQAAVARIHQAGIRAERGDRAGAAALRPEEAHEGVPAGIRAVGIDVAIGIAWQWGTKEEVRALLSRLGATEGPDGVAFAFRRAQLLRGDGDLAGAEAEYQALAARMAGAGTPGAEAAAAVEAERAEIALLEGRRAEALAGYERAAAAHEAAGRRSLAFRAEAGRVRAATDAGLHVLLSRVEEGLLHASSRGLVPLGIELEAALGEGLAARDPAGAALRLEAALAAAEAAGLRQTAGRIRLALASRTRQPADRRAALAAQAAEDLADDVPWRDRAVAAAG